MSSPLAASAGEVGDARRSGSIGRLAGAIYLSTLLGLATAPVAARALGAEGRGAYAAVTTYALLATVLLAFGLSPAVMWAVGTERLDVARVLGACARFCTLVSPAAVALGIAVTFLVFDGDGTTTQVAAFVFVALTPLSVYQVCLASVLTARGALAGLALIRTAPILIGAAGVLTLAAVGALTLGSYLAITLAGGIVALLLSVRAAHTGPRRGLSMRPLLRFGSSAYVGSLANLGNAQLDQALIAPFLGLRDLGHYAVAVTISSVPMGLIQANAIGAVSEMTEDGGALSVGAVAARMRLSVLVAGVACGGLAIIVPFAVPVLFGAEFGPTTGLCLVLLAGVIAQAIAAVANSALVMAGRPRVASAAELVTLAITGAGLAIALPLAGVMGAAIVSVVAYWGRALIEIRALRRLGVHDMCPRARDVAALWARVTRRRRSSPEAP